MDTGLSFGKYLKTLRKNSDLSLEDVEKESGVSVSHLSRVERGSRNPTPDILKKIARPLDVSYECLMIKAGFINAQKIINQYTESENKKVPTSGSMQRPESVKEAKKILKEERFVSPDCNLVTFETDEFTSVCPRTGQPDFSSLEIKYTPDKYCIESKSLKFYLWSFRQYGAFSETLAAKIADEVVYAINPKYVKVTIYQNIRGGIALTSTAEREQ